jgi:hypothetical protein
MKLFPPEFFSDTTSLFTAQFARGSFEIFLLIFFSSFQGFLGGTKVKVFASPGILKNNSNPIIKLATSLLNIGCFSVENPIIVI